MEALQPNNIQVKLAKLMEYVIEELEYQSLHSHKYNGYYYNIPVGLCNAITQERATLLYGIEFRYKDMLLKVSRNHSSIRNDRVYMIIWIKDSNQES